MGKAMSPSCPKELLAPSGIAKTTSALSTDENATLMLFTVQSVFEAAAVNGNRAPARKDFRRIVDIGMMPTSLLYYSCLW